MWESINTYLHTYHLTADVCLALIWRVTDDLQNCRLHIVHIGISENHNFFRKSFDNSVIFLGSLH